MRPQVAHSIKNAEWLFAVFFLLFLSSLFFISAFHRANQFQTLEELSESFPEKYCLVTISGHVTKPGVYEILKGTDLSTILKKVKPKKFADLKQLKLNSPIEEDLYLHIEELKTIHIKIEGEVIEKKELDLPLYSRISDLKSKIECTAEADHSFFKKKRMLVDEEVIEVPRKHKKNCTGPL